MTMFDDALKLLDKRKKYVNPYNYNIVYFGDSWVGENANTSNAIFKSALEEARKYNPLLILHGGDIVYTGAKENFEFFMDFKNKNEPDIPLFVTVGNHEMEFVNPMDQPQSVVNFEEMIGPVHYVLNIPDYNLRLISLNVLDQYIYKQYGLKNAQLMYLRDNLKGSSLNNFVMLHVPPKTDKWQDPDEFFSIGSESFFSEVKDKVESVLTSHVHAFMKTKYKHTRVLVTGGGGAALAKEQIFHIVVINIKCHGNNSKVSYDVVPIGY